MNSASFVGSFTGDGGAGVASLDPPLIQQTKSEIRTLSAEIAKLAHSTLEPTEFYRGFLPRLVTAMGAEGAAVWQTFESLQKRGVVDTLNSQQQSSLRLLAQHCLAPELTTGELTTNSTAPTESHRKILECVIAEGSPILVPPQTVSIDADRPVNPLEHSLIVIPVRIEDEVEFVLEVVQSSSGGPAAQRGYLRFVAQMADLMADYLRRQSLREHAAQTARLQQFEFWLTSIAQAENSASQLRLAADGLAELLNSYQVFILKSGRRPKVIAASGLETFDPRSETILAAEVAERFLQQQTASNETYLDLCQWKAGDGRLTSVSNLYDLMASEKLVRLRVAEHVEIVAILALDDNLSASPAEMERVASSLFGLVDLRAARSSWFFKWLPVRRAAQTITRPKAAWQRWGIRIAFAVVSVVLAFLPVPQQISTTAVLAPKFKNCYYAPLDATVASINVAGLENEPIQKGAVLLKLESAALSQSLSRLEAEQAANRVSKEILDSAISNAAAKAGMESDRRVISAELAQVNGRIDANDHEQDFIKAEMAKLEIRAQENGTLTTWDISNRLLGRPVARGELLLSTCDPSAEWELQVSIPEHRVGLVSDALARSEGKTVPMRFSLTSHPNVLLDGGLSSLADQATRNASGSNVVLSKAVVIGDLPLKKEGAIANVTIDCGRVPAIWLVVRDAYWACMSRLKMMW